MNPNLLYNAARKIASQSEKPAYFFIETIINTPQGDIPTKFSNAFFHNSDYVTKFTSEIEVRVGMTIADYRKYCWLNRDNLRVTLKFNTGNPITNAQQAVPPTVRSYRALLLDNSDPSITRGNALVSGTFIDGSDDLIVFYMQLIDEGALKVRTAVVSGLYPQAKDNGELLRGILARMARETQGFNILGMTPVDVTDPQDVTMIPPDVKPSALPLYIQQHEGGLYNHGCGCFLLDRTMWVFPPYDVKRYAKRLSDKTEKVLEIYQVPTTMVPTSESTWEIEDNIVRIVCTGSAVVQDLSVGQSLSKGNGTRYIRADRFINAPTVNRGDNTAQINRATYMAEYQTSVRPDGLQIARMSDARVTANDAEEISKLAAREGQIFQTTWQNSRGIELLHAGMPVRIHHDKGGYVSTRDGVLIDVQEAFLPASQGIANQAMTRGAGLTLFIAKEETTGVTI